MGDVRVLKSKKKRFSRKDEIIRQASTMFKERGYSGASVRDLAQLAGIEAPSLYSHFKSKEDILKFICGEMANKFMKGMDKAEKMETPTEKIQAAIHSHIRTITKNLDASAVMWHEWKHLRGKGLDDFKEKKKNYEIRFQEILKHGIETGEFGKFDPVILSNLIFSSLNGLSFWYHGNIGTKRIIKCIQNLLFHGIKNQK